jgi:Tol biopolymer transport system component
MRRLGKSKRKYIRSLAIAAWCAVLGGCTGYPRILNFPFDPGGRSLNSLASELTPQIASNYITFVSDRNGSQDIYLFDARDRRLIELPGLNSLDEIASEPAVSENGRFIAFVLSRQGKSTIAIYDRSTQQKRNLTPNIQAQVRRPSISADGSIIAFEVADRGQWDILVYRSSGQPLDLPGTPRI